MIVYEQPESYVMIRQNDHAHVSGQVVEQWYQEHPAGEWWSDTVYAVYNHDISWIGLDAMPLWNDQKQQPYTFSDFPRIPKLAFYKLGLDETEKNNAYAALLCSMHYSSFFRETTQPDEMKFLSEEHERQEHIKHRCGVCHQKQLDMLDHHFHLLQFCDDVSLYICLNKPGASKEEEHPWYKEGFKSAKHLVSQPSSKMMARWKGEEHIVFEPFPFKEEFLVHLTFKEVSKVLVRQNGIADAYEAAASAQRNITIVRSQKQ